MEDCSFLRKPPSHLFIGRESTTTELEPFTGKFDLVELLKPDLLEEDSFASSATALEFTISEKSSTNAKSITGVHCPGNRAVYELELDMTDIELFRFEMPLPLRGEGLLEDVAGVGGREDDDDGLLTEGNILCDFTNGIKACFADCSTRKIFRT